MKASRRFATGRLGAAVGIALALLLSPASARELPRPETFTLRNGLQVVVITDRRAPVVTQMLWYRVGAADEPVGHSGIAHFFEHLMFKGTRDIPPGEFSRIIARNGGDNNAFTAKLTHFQGEKLEQFSIGSEEQAKQVVTELEPS